MSDEGSEYPNILTLKIPSIKADTETQTSGQLVSRSPESKESIMETVPQNMSIRKRRNLSKNRSQATRHREKTPEPSRMGIPHEDTTTSDDEDIHPNRSSREIEADNTYEEMKRKVHEQATTKDPVYDMDVDELREQRAQEATNRRRRSISPFAMPDLEEKEGTKLERKGSFINPTNKLLSTTYTLSPKDEDNARRNSLTMEIPRERKSSLSPPATSSPKDKDFPYPIPSTPKKLEKMIYADEINNETENLKIQKSPTKKEEVFTFETKDEKSVSKPPKTPDTPATPGELVTKVIQIERTPSRKVVPENKPVVEIRERIVRTPSRKSVPEAKPILPKQQPPKQEETLQSKVPPVKPVRGKSASRFGGKTSESEMSEDQSNSLSVLQSKRKVIPTPRRFLKNRSPRANRSQSVNRTEDVKVLDKTGSGMSQTSREIIELMQIARARSLSIPKDDPRVPQEYKKEYRYLQTPNKTPSTPKRSSRGISCPKTIQIISDKEILSGISNEPPIKTKKDKGVRNDKTVKSPKTSGYLDASQSEYTSSCYSSSPSENEYDFDLSERTDELARKLHILSQKKEEQESKTSIIFSNESPSATIEEPKSVLRKRSIAEPKKPIIKKDSKSTVEPEKPKIKLEKDKYKKNTRSRWKFIANWQELKQEYKSEYDGIKYLTNRCICDMFLLITLCGLGGIMFKALEGSFENAYKCGSRNVKRDFIESLWRGSHYLREEDWKSMARKKLFEFEDQLHTAHEAGVTSYSGQRSWNFMNSFVYCLTIITTVGYGHIAPKTFYGRVATIVYAIIGIPLFLIVLADFGKLFTRIIKFFWAYIRRFYYTRSCRKVRRTAPMQEVMKGLNIVYDVVRRPSQIFNEEDMETSPNGENPPPIERKPSDVPPPLPPKPPGTIILETDEIEPDTPAPSVYEIDDEFNLPISVAIFILIVYIFIGAVGYNIWENWSFFESFYFVFISMSTIGLGDLVPDHPMFMMASILYLVFGLALTSMCINVVQVKLSDTFKQASAKLGATIGLKVAEEDGSLVPTTPIATEIVPVHKPKSEGESKKEDDNDKNR